MKSIRQASLIYILGTVFTKFSKFLLLPLYISELNPDEIGLLAISESISTFMTVLLTLGLPNVIQKFIHATEKSFFPKIVWYKITTSIFCMGLFLCLFNFIKLTISFEAYVLSVLIGFFQSNLILLENKYIAEERPFKHRAYTFGRFISITIPIIIAVVFFDAGFIEILWVNLIILLIWNIPFLYEFPIVRWSFTEIKPQITFGLKGIVSGITTWGLVLSDRLILQAFVPLKSLSEYSIGYQLAMAISIITIGIRDAWRPKLLKLELESVKKSLSFQTIMYSILMATICLVYFILLEVTFPRIGILEQYKPALQISKIVVLGIFIHSLVVNLLTICLIESKIGTISIVTGITFIVSLTLNLLLVPTYGTIAAAWVTVISYLLQFLFLIVVINHSFKLKISLKVFLTQAILILALTLIFILPSHL